MLGAAQRQRCNTVIIDLSVIRREYEGDAVEISPMLTDVKLFRKSCLQSLVHSGDSR